MPDNFNAIIKGIWGILLFIIKKKWQNMPEEIIGENKFEYLVSVEISLESTCAFVLKHLDTEYVIVNITYFL